MGFAPNLFSAVSHNGAEVTVNYGGLFYRFTMRLFFPISTGEASSEAKVRKQRWERCRPTVGVKLRLSRAASEELGSTVGLAMLCHTLESFLRLLSSTRMEFFSLVTMRD